VDLTLAVEIYRHFYFKGTAFVVQWSDFLATDPEVRVRFPELPDFLRSLERGPFILMSTTEELLERNSSDSGLENPEYGRRDPSR
jgi:hypothetical protein